MRRILFPVLGAVIALVLAGCTITIEPVIPPNAVKVTANENPNTPVYGDSLSAGAAEVFEITIPQAVQDGYDVVYVELDTDIELELRAANYASVLMSSNSSEYFGRYSTGLQALDADLDSQAITSLVNCRGSCVIFEPTSSTYYARVKNDSGAPASYELYVFGDVLQDDTEPANGSRGSAPTLVVGSNVSGAIETINDVDFWYVSGSGTIAFDAGSPALSLEAHALDSNGVVVAGPYTSGDQFEVFNGEYVRVRSVTERAAASAKSVYYLGAP